MTVLTRGLLAKRGLLRLPSRNVLIFSKIILGVFRCIGCPVRVQMNVCVGILTYRLTWPPALSTNIVFTHTVLPPICSAVRVQSCLTEDLPMKGLALASDCHVRPAWFRCRPVGPSRGFYFLLLNSTTIDTYSRIAFHMRMCVWDMAPLNRMTRPCAVVPLNRMPNRM